MEQQATLPRPTSAQLFGRAARNITAIAAVAAIFAAKAVDADLIVDAPPVAPPVAVAATDLP